MKISVLIPHFNRVGLLSTSIRSVVEQTKFPKADYEIVIIDDGSDPEQIPHISLLDFQDENIKIKSFTREEKTWHCPCVPFNEACRISTGELLILQSPECLHVGDILSNAWKHVHKGEYRSYAAYQCTKEQNMGLALIDVPMNREKIEAVLEPMRMVGDSSNYNAGWYNHSVLRPMPYHFCSAITRADMEDLNGFDERYGPGVAFDDDEFLFRVRKKGMEIKIIDWPFVVHQNHKKVLYEQEGASELWARNAGLFHNVTENSDGWKVKEGIVHE